MNHRVILLFFYKSTNFTLFDLIEMEM